MRKECSAGYRELLKSVALSEGNLGAVGLIEDGTIFNNPFRQARQELELTQKQLGEAIGVSGTTIGHIETFQIYPNPDLQRRLTNALGKEAEELFPQWLKEIQIPIDENFEPEAIKEDCVERQELLAMQSGVTNFQDKQADPNGYIEQQDISRIIRSYLEGNVLTLREKKILVLRYGLQGEEPQTLEQIAKYFGVTRERVRQIERRIIEKLKTPKNAVPFSGYKEVYNKKPKPLAGVTRTPVRQDNIIKEASSEDKQNKTVSHSSVSNETKQIIAGSVRERMIDMGKRVWKIVQKRLNTVR